MYEVFTSSVHVPVQVLMWSVYPPWTPFSFNMTSPYQSV
jgi:hypothetical protein